jgi:hypothetical protein
VAPRQFRPPGQHHWRCRPTRWCLACLPAGRFFARHLDYFIVTRNSQPLLVPIAIGIVTLTQLHRDPWLRSRLPGLPDAPLRYGQGRCKKLGTATLRYRSGQAPTAPNQTAGPLALTPCSRDSLSVNPKFQNSDFSISQNLSRTRQCRYSIKYFSKPHGFIKICANFVVTFCK